MTEYRSGHIPVLIEEFLEFFQPLEIRCFVDATLGGGGHAEAILRAHPEIETLIGIDADPQALTHAKKRLIDFEKKVELVQGNFRYLSRLVSRTKVEAIFFDIGISSMQLDEGERGFSFLRDAPLDMRKDPTQEIDAAWVVNNLPEVKLGEVFRDFGEERKWRQAARAIVEARKKRKINTTFELNAVLEKVLFRQGKLHPMTRLFQALRIYVNDELKSLEEAIGEGISLLTAGGRMGVISFHSLEDRIVKNLFREAALAKRTKTLTKKPLVATRDEIRKNPRSRSAKLRFLEKL